MTWWNRLTYVAVCLLFAAGGVAIFVWNLPVVQTNQRLQRQKLEVSASVDYLKKEIAFYRFQLQELEHNPKAVERLAREKLGYSLAGETVVFFVPSASPPTTLRTDASRDLR